MNQLARRESWTPFRELNRLRNDIESIFDRPFSFWPTADFYSGWSPAVDIVEDKDKFIVTAELPGMKKEDIDISMEGNTLCICGERSEQKEERAGREVRRAERYYGRFQRNLTLAQSVDSNKIEARYKDGVLTITLPKTEESKRKQIEVKVS